MAQKLLDNVNLLGLGAFRGGGMDPLYGAAIGGGVTATTLLVARHLGGFRHAELVALAIGGATTGLMAAMPSTRGAAVTSGLVTLLIAGVPLLGKLFGEATVPAVAVTPEVKGLGFPQARALNGLGYPQVQALNGVGLPTMAPVAHAQGAIPGVAGSQLAGPGGGAPPVSLMGSPSAAQVHLLGIGGPPTHSLSAAYGATLLGAGR